MAFFALACRFWYQKNAQSNKRVKLTRYARLLAAYAQRQTFRVVLGGETHSYFGSFKFFGAGCEWQ